MIDESWMIMTEVTRRALNWYLQTENWNEHRQTNYEQHLHKMNDSFGIMNRYILWRLVESRSFKKITIFDFQLTCIFQMLDVDIFTTRKWTKWPYKRIDEMNCLIGILWQLETGFRSGKKLLNFCSIFTFQKKTRLSLILRFYFLFKEICFFFCKFHNLEEACWWKWWKTELFKKEKICIFTAPKINLFSKFPT